MTLRTSQNSSRNRNLASQSPRQNRSRNIPTLTSTRVNILLLPLLPKRKKRSLRRWMLKTLPKMLKTREMKHSRRRISMKLSISMTRQSGLTLTSLFTTTTKQLHILSLSSMMQLCKKSPMQRSCSRKELLKTTSKRQRFWQERVLSFQSWSDMVRPSIFWRRVCWRIITVRSEMI